MYYELIMSRLRINWKWIRSELGINYKLTIS